MTHLTWALFLWSAVFILIPLKRIKELKTVSIISFLLLLLIDSIFIKEGHYVYSKMLFPPILGVPFCYLVGGAAGGMILINWLPRSPLNKLVYIFIFSFLFNISESIFIFFGAFHYVKFSQLMSFTLNVAGFFVLKTICLAVVGEKKIYLGQKSRLKLK